MGLVLFGMHSQKRVMHQSRKTSAEKGDVS